MGAFFQRCLRGGGERSRFGKVNSKRLLPGIVRASLYGNRCRYRVCTFLSLFFFYFPAAVNYLGCYSSPSGMVLASDFSAAALTPESCVTVCGKANMKYAGVTTGSQCYCSNTAPDTSKDIGHVACYYPCLGDKGLKCGSHLYFSIYEAPGQFHFPFALSVANSSEAFAVVRFTIIPPYDGADVWLNFGDGTVINTKGASYYDYMFTTLGTHQVIL